MGKKAIKGKKEAYAKCKTSYREDRTERITVENECKENRNSVKMKGPDFCVVIPDLPNSSATSMIWT